MKKQILSMCLVVALCLGMLPVTALAVEEAPVYLALGDSITTGYAPPDEEGNPQTIDNPFANQVADELGYTLNKKYAQDGETSTLLLEQLQSEAIDVSGTSLITITIGGNDLMEALYAHLTEQYNEGKEETEKITPEKLEEALADPSGENVTILLAILMSLDEYLKDFLDSQAASAAFGSVQANLTEILKTIRQKNSTAKILVATQYDPYQWISVSDKDAFKDRIYALQTTFDSGVAELNTRIQAAVAAVNDSNISVVEVCSAFAGSTKNLCNANYNGIADFSLDFHPN